MFFYGRTRKYWSGKDNVESLKLIKKEEIK